MSIGISNIENITFGINSDIENEKNGFVEINNVNAFDPNGLPHDGGIYDIRLGTTDHNQMCAICFNGKKLCPGHRGYLKLKAAVLQPIAISEIRQWLRIVCLSCGSLMMEKSKIAKIPPARRMNEASVGSEGKECPYCKVKHPKIKKDKEDRFTFWISYQQDTDDEFIDSSSAIDSKKLYPDTIKKILKNVSNETVEILGKTIHPSKLVLNVIEVPPNTIRPGIKNFNGEGSSSYHDSTNILQHLIKRNNDYIPTDLPNCVVDITDRQELSNVNRELDKTLLTLQQFYYDLIMGSDSTNVMQGNTGKRGLVIGNRPVHSFLRNLPRKEGRIRANLLGKRAFFTSRTTISGNVAYKIDEVGIPIEFAKVLQVEEYVQDYNIEWLTTIFLNGRTQYPGCSHVIRKSTGEMHDVSKLTNGYLEIGDILYRDVINGDYAYFNRMPTLQRSSICVHKVIVIKDPSIHTFQMNVLACELYNADFDGDQMHIWIARGVNQRVEAAIMSAMSNWFISTKTSGTVNGQVQDSIIGCYEITRTNTVMDKYHAMALFSQLSLPVKFNQYAKDHLFTGRDIMSLLSFTPINYKAVPRTYNELYKQYIKFDPTETIVDIKNGYMNSGVFESSIIGTGKIGGLFHLINREYDSHAALDVIYAMQQIALQFLMWKGFTVGTGDIIMDEESIEQTNASISATLMESELITKRLLEGKIVPPIGSTVYEFYESLQKEALQVNTTEIFRWITKSIDTNSNNFFKMIFCGSKGGTPQLISIMSAIGRTIVNGKRIQELFSFRRTSPYCPRFATDAKSYGFVANSYVSGMTSTEFIFQDMNSRFDLINKALTTATTGYFMKKGIMNNQSSIVDNYRRVVKGQKIVQFIYGEDGLDSRELENVKYPLTFMSNTEVINWSSPMNDNGLTSEVKEWQNQLLTDRDQYRLAYMSIEATHLKQTFTDIITVSVNVKRIIEKVKNMVNVLPTPLSLEKLNNIKYLYNNLPYCLLNDIQETKRAPIPIHKQKACKLLCMLIRAELNPKILENLAETQVEHIIRLIRVKYANSLIEYGTAVGILAVQSISEPITQYMLDSHHRSVGSGTSKAGMVRISEIYGTCSINKEQTPSMLLTINKNLFRDNKSNAASIAQEIANSIEFLSFKQFIKNIAVLLEPHSKLIHPKYKSDIVWINEFAENHPLNKAPSELTNWCFRFVIDKSNLVLKSVDLQLIIQKLKSKHPNTYIIFTPEASPEIIIRIWNKPSQKRGTSIDDTYTELLTNILETPIRGITRIMNTTVEKRIKYVLGPDNAFIKEDNHVIITHGTNLYNILINNNIFDTTCIASNSIPDTFNMYGIEAARTKIINETKIIVADSNVNIRHLYIYADERTRTGRVTSFERGGLAAREHNNVLLRAGYHDPIRCLIDAALNNTKSNIYGIAACQLLGTIPKIGSIYNSLVVDETFVKENVKTVDEILDNL